MVLADRYKLSMMMPAGAATGHTVTLPNPAMNSVVSFDHLVGAYPNGS
jgi:hypothetical protein